MLRSGEMPVSPRGEGGIKLPDSHAQLSKLPIFVLVIKQQGGLGQGEGNPGDSLQRAQRIKEVEIDRVRKYGRKSRNSTMDGM